MRTMPSSHLTCPFRLSSKARYVHPRLQLRGFAVRRVARLHCVGYVVVELVEDDDDTAIVFVSGPAQKLFILCLHNQTYGSETGSNRHCVKGATFSFETRFIDEKLSWTRRNDGRGWMETVVWRLKVHCESAILSATHPVRSKSGGSLKYDLYVFRTYHHNLAASTL